MTPKEFEAVEQNQIDDNNNDVESNARALRIFRTMD